MSNTPKKPFFQRTWVMVVMLLFIAPVGIFLIWKNCPRWHPAVKAGLSVMFGLIWIGAVIGGGGSAEPSRNVPQAVVNTEQDQPTDDPSAQPAGDDPVEAEGSMEIDPSGTPQELVPTETDDPEPAPTPDRSTPTPEPTPAPAPTPEPTPEPSPTPTPTPEPDPVPDRSIGDDSKELSDPGASGWTYVGSIESDKYHYPSCRHAEKILAENLIGWNTIEEAQAAGYKPCGVCHPH